MRWANPASHPSGFPRCIAGSAYHGVPRRVLLAYKEQGMRLLASRLAPLMAAAIEAAAGTLVSSGSRVALVPIPTTPAARRRRGCDHLRPLIAAARRANPGLFDVWPLLRAAEPSTGATRLDSVGLSAAARRRNIAGCFRLSRKPAGGRWHLRGAQLLLSDDVVTSGATLTEAANTLRAAGLEVAGAVTLAAVT